MFCKYCGKPIPDGAKYCPDCGPGKRPPVSGLIQGFRPESDPSMSDRTEPFSPPEYFASARCSAQARQRVRSLWIGFGIGSALPAVILPVLGFFAEQYAVPFILAAPLMMGVIPFGLGLLVCLRKSYKLAWLHLVVTIYTDFLMVAAPIAELIILSRLHQEYKEYLRQWKAEHPGLLPD